MSDRLCGVCGGSRGPDCYCDKGLEAAVNRAMRRVSEQREAIIEAFLAETGLMPSECEQVETINADGTRSWYVRKREEEA